MIKWKNGQFSSVHGYAGKWNVFVMSWSTTRNDPKPWVLSSSLPGMGHSQYETSEEAKAAAEVLWASWLKVAGATP